MTLTYGLTRSTIRQSIGLNALGPELFISTLTSVTSTTVAADTNQIGSDNAHNTKWFVGGSNGDVVRVSDYTSSTGTYTLSTAITGTFAAGNAYELWPTAFPPSTVNDFIDQAMRELLGQAWDYEESLALHGDGWITRFTVPTEFDMVNRVEWRSYVPSIEVHPTSVAFDESVDADFTVTVDTEIKKSGQSVKFVAAGTVSNGDFATDSIGSTDISSYTHLEFWIRVKTAVSSGDLNILLDDTAACVSPAETLIVPAVSAETWTFVRIALANPESDTAIISVGLEYNANAGANTIWIDYLRATRADEADWTPLPHRAWGIDREAGDFILKPDGRSTVGHSLLKLKGGSKPTTLTSDLTSIDIRSDPIIAIATYSLLLTNPSFFRDRIGDTAIRLWAGRAEAARRKFAINTGVREVPR